MRKRLSIDLEVLSNLDLGIDAIAYTSDPAIELFGVALNKVKKISSPSNLKFADEKKMQIAGPIMAVKDIYRYDSEDGEYDIIFDYETNRALYNQLMKKLPMLGKETIFNDEHISENQIKAHMLNAMFVESQEEIDYIKKKYNHNVELGTVWVLTQVNDKKTYDYLVKNDKIGFSIEGLFKLDEVIKSQLNNNKIRMSKKLKFQKVRFILKKGKFATEVSEIEVENGDIEIGSEVIVTDDSGEVIENWSGEAAILDEVSGDIVEVTIKDDEIIEIDGETVETETDLNEDEKKEELESVDEVEEEVKEEVKETEEELTDETEDEKKEELEDSTVEYATKEELEHLIALVADLQAQIGMLNLSGQTDEDVKENKEENFKRQLAQAIAKRNK